MKNILFLALLISLVSCKKENSRYSKCGTVIIEGRGTMVVVFSDNTFIGIPRDSAKYFKNGDSYCTKK